MVCMCSQLQFSPCDVNKTLLPLGDTINSCQLLVVRRGSRILQGRVSNQSERGTGGRGPSNYFDPCYRKQTIFLALEEIVGARRSYDI